MRAKNTQAISRSAALVNISAAVVTAGMSRFDLGDGLCEVGYRFAQRLQAFAVWCLDWIVKAARPSIIGHVSLSFRPGAAAGKLQVNRCEWRWSCGFPATAPVSPETAARPLPSRPR
jgi:hypothetical protein